MTAWLEVEHPPSGQLRLWREIVMGPEMDMLPHAALPVLAWIGLGNMGKPMAGHLVDAGYEVRGHDVSDDALTLFAARGGIPASSAAQAAGGAGVVILMLPDSTVVESVVADPAFLKVLTPATTVVDMSSSEPERTRILARLLGERGVSLIDAPVSGGVRGAEAASLSIMAGGTDQQVAPVADVLARMGKVFRAGPVGAGHAVKALNNLMSGVHLLASSEAILAGQRFGVDPAVILSIVNASTGRSWSTQTKWPNFILPEDYTSGFALQLLLKDMRIAVGLARQLGMPFALAEQATALWAQAAESLPAGADHTEIARWLRDISTGADSCQGRAQK